MKKILALSMVLFLLYSCGDQCCNSGRAVPIREHSVQSVNWQQLSAEYRALAYQAYNIAKSRLDEILESKKKSDKLAVITDIDETVIDNSPYNARLIKEEKEYDRESWIQWGKEKKAGAAPGAVEFFNYAADKGVEVFYISNRYDTQKKETMENLDILGLPFIDEEHFLLREKSGGKKPRREMVMENFEVVLLLGDNLSDFSELFDGQPTEKRNRTADDLREEFGKKFIVFPNPMYGDWETKGLYEGKYDWTPVQKDSLRKAKLILN